MIARPDLAEIERLRARVTELEAKHANQRDIIAAYQRMCGNVPHSRELRPPKGGCMKPEPKLEPCPHGCVGQVSVPEVDIGSFRGHCHACGALGPTGYTREQGAQLWNTRTPPSAGVREPTEAQVEAAAAAMYTSWAHRTYGKLTVDDARWEKQWPQQDAEMRAMWCADARAALKAAGTLPVPDLAPASWPMPATPADLADIIRIERGKAYEFRGQEAKAEVEAARREAFEQAAKVADWYEAHWRPKPGDIGNAFANGSSETARKIAAVIREPTEDKG